MKKMLLLAAMLVSNQAFAYDTAYERTLPPDNIVTIKRIAKPLYGQRQTREERELVIRLVIQFEELQNQPETPPASLDNALELINQRTNH